MIELPTRYTLFPYTTLFRSQLYLHPQLSREAGGALDLVYYAGNVDQDPRSEEHTSELQSRRDLVCRLLLEKKNRMALSRLRCHHRELHISLILFSIL